RVMLAALVPAMLVIAQPDLGSGMVYLVVAFTLLFVAGTPWRQLGALVALVLAALAFVLAVAPLAGVHVIKPYQQERLTAFLHPSANPQKQGYQQEEAKIAIGSGQKTGRGTHASQIPNGFVPESHTDFIFAAVGEQYGFVGAALVLSLFGLLIWRALRILVMSKDLYGSLVAGGVAGYAVFPGVLYPRITTLINPLHPPTPAPSGLGRSVRHQHLPGVRPFAFDLGPGAGRSGAEGPRHGLLAADGPHLSPASQPASRCAARSPPRRGARAARVRGHAGGGDRARSREPPPGTPPRPRKRGRRTVRPPAANRAPIHPTLAHRASTHPGLDPFHQRKTGSN